MVWACISTLSRPPSAPSEVIVIVDPRSSSLVAVPVRAEEVVIMQQAQMVEIVLHLDIPLQAGARVVVALHRMAVLAVADMAVTVRLLEVLELLVKEALVVLAP